MIQNLDPNWLKTYGELGARALLLSVADIQKAEMFPQDDLQRNNLFGAVAQVFGAEAPSSEYLVGAYLHHKSWVVVVTTYPEVRDLMVRLGGMVRGAQVLDRGEVELDWVGGKAGNVNEIGFEASLDFMGTHMQFGAGDPSQPRFRMRTKTGNFQPYAIWFKTTQIETLESSDRFQCSHAILRGLWRQLSSEM
jgi:hypothetical protein